MKKCKANRIYLESNIYYYNIEGGFQRVQKIQKTNVRFACI